MSVLVTGGAGFIGSNFVLDWLAQSGEAVINLDNLTYAGKRWHFCIDGGVSVSSPGRVCGQDSPGSLRSH